MTKPQTNNHVAKSCSAWTEADLRLCNVKIIDADVPTFFGIQRLPSPSVSPAVLNTKASSSSQPTHNHTALTNEERMFFKYLQAASVPSEHQEADIREFTAHLLQLLSYTAPNPSKQHPEEASQERRVIRKEHDLPLFMCARTVHAIADVCLLIPSTSTHHGDSILLIAKASPTTASKSETSASASATASASEARLVAQAIAAYQSQNRARGRARLSPAEKHIVPGLIMSGTMPVLYKIGVTAELVESVQTAQVPPTATEVQRLVLPVEGPVSVQEGMIPLENRKVMLACLEAFKALV
ncbi:hypothetical protein FPV67DRAFT_1484990 [Lyophyllum atratum]|nr:hypothetical protein FPV67DRAFT_1484990 [Lyophyllum atratum]